MFFPVRKIGMGYGGSLRGAFPSRKGAGRVVRTESALERSFCLLLEFDAAVRAYGEQPVAISFAGPGETRVRRYTPDFLVEYWQASRPPVLAEVKYQAELAAKAAALAPKFAAARRYAAERGWAFRVYTEADILTPLLGNARLLLGFRELAPLPAADGRSCAEWLLELLARAGESTPAALVAAAAEQTGLAPAAVLPHCWHLLGRFLIGCDLAAKPLAMNTPVWAL